MTSSFRAPSIPPLSAIAYKEWAGVCEALESGRQSILLRKGGIAEHEGVFRPDYPCFWLYPTSTHQLEQGIKPDAEFSLEHDRSSIRLSAFVVVQEIFWTSSEETLAGLDTLHVWTPDTIRKRFAYRRPGLWVLGVRVYRSPVPTHVAEQPEYLGCKTWVALNEPLGTQDLTPVIDDRSADILRHRLRDHFANEMGSNRG